MALGGGLMFLARELIVGGVSHPMSGVLDLVVDGSIQAFIDLCFRYLQGFTGQGGDTFYQFFQLLPQFVTRHHCVHKTILLSLLSRNILSKEKEFHCLS